ncbi:MAG: hypothetical protein E5299_00302 [Burkholderia gladioli]|nr:MAG: hypothetical protein E5299_00302 [Burkholderia gladioli]
MPRIRYIGSRRSPETVSGRLHIDSQSTEVAVRISLSNRAWRTSLVRNPFVSSEIMPVGAIASARSIYTTTPFVNVSALIDANA